MPFVNPCPRLKLKLQVERFHTNNKYEAGSFASWNIMDQNSLAPFEIVQIRAASNLKKTELKVIYQGHDIGS